MSRQLLTSDENTIEVEVDFDNESIFVDGVEQETSGSFNDNLMFLLEQGFEVPDNE